MSSTTNRRRFLQTAGATAAGFWVAGGVASPAQDSPNMKVNNVDGLDFLIKPTYPDGYTLDV